MLKQLASILPILNHGMTNIMVQANLPLIPGLDAAGIIEEVGFEVQHLKVGQRVSYSWAPMQNI